VNQLDHIVEALEIVSAQNIPDEDFVQVVNDRARLISMVSPDDIPERRSDIN